MKHTTPPRFRAVAALVALALPAVALSARPAQAGPVSAAAGTDPRPAALGASWLADQLDDGLMHNPNFGGFDDYGLSIDAALALDAVGGQDAAVTAVTDAIAANLDSYTTGADWGSPSDVYAGAAGKALALVTSQGRDPRNVGGRDLLARVEGTVLADPGLEGRIADTGAADYANVIGQAFAARGLHEAGSGLADEVTGYLLDQQCAEGFFRLGFPARAAADQTCDGDPYAAADPDATALAALALLGQRGDAGVDRALDAAADWLQARQRRTGALGGGTATERPNTNSTGLAGWLFGELGRADAAARAATWVRVRQADDPRGCRTDLARSTGAVGYDDAGVATGRDEGVTDLTSDQWRRATSQALPVLAWAPAGTGPDVAGPDGFVRGGTAPKVRVTGAAPGSSVCVVGAGRQRLDHANRGGAAAVRVPVPARTRIVGVVARSGAGALDRDSLAVLGRTTLRPAVAGSVRRGARQVVEVGGLAAGERVTVRYRGSIVARRTADAQGEARAAFRVGRATGQRAVVVVGQFPDRRGSAAFRVRR